MTIKIQIALFIAIIASIVEVEGQKVMSDSTLTSQDIKFKYKSLIIPTLLIGYGVVGIENDGLKMVNAEVKDEVTEHIDEKMTFDDFSQYVPFLSVYGLNALGIKGRNNFKQRTVILATSYLIMGSVVSGLKLSTKIDRPDGSTKNSFPSGHTATAFMGAEFLWQEYRDVSLWYGISGYLVAIGTGFFRIHNDRHWLTDVATGAGIGILSTKTAYWINPLMKNLFSKKKSNDYTNTIFYPYYNGKQLGLGFSMNF